MGGTTVKMLACNKEVVGSILGRATTMQQSRASSLHPCAYVSYNHTALKM